MTTKEIQETALSAVPFAGTCNYCVKRNTSRRIVIRKRQTIRLAQQTEADKRTRTQTRRAIYVARKATLKRTVEKKQKTRTRSPTGLKRKQTRQMR